LIIDSLGQRARVETIAVDDHDTIRQGELYFDSEVSLTSLEIQSSSGATLHSFLKRLR
jgi:hypothetical protein